MCAASLDDRAPQPDLGYLASPRIIILHFIEKVDRVREAHRARQWEAAYLVSKRWPNVKSTANNPCPRMLEDFPSETHAKEVHIKAREWIALPASSGFPICRLA